MALKIYNASASKARSGKATVNIAPKSGLISISKAAAEIMKIKAKDKLILAQDDQNPKDWYLAIHDSGFSARGDDGRLFFNSCAIAKSFCDSIGVDYPSSYLIGKKPTKIDGLDCWPIFVSSGIKKD